MRLKGRLVVATLASTCMLFAAGCGNATGGSKSSAGSSGSSANGCDVKEIGPGVTDSEIRVGTTMPLSGSGAAGGLGTKEGQEAYYAKLNAEGGVQGRKIKPIILDDAYDPSTAQKQMRQLVEKEEILVVSGGEGTPNFLGAVPYLDRKKVPAIAPYAPSDELGGDKNQHVFMATVDYIQEFEILTDYVLDQETPKKMALVGVAGNVGDNAKLGMEKALEGKGIELLYVPETPGTTDFTPIATQLKQFDAEYVFLILTNADTGGLLQAMSRIGYTPKTGAWAGMSDDSYIKEFGALSQDMLVALETSSLESDNPLVKQFVADFTAQTGKAPSKFNQLGWVQAQLTAEALKRAEGLNRGCVVEALETFENFETGILPPVTWGKGDRAGVDAVGIGQIKGDKLVVLEETKSLQK
ncbi:ABC transporter substrate-binding protein [Micromonospora gifhornensis]|uniref:Branched-chain amino acid ABC transporter substrate-binding protein n=1 Tax=Micromonospora gifhornensis TaxID=84594 RepID=A0ABQ4ILF8_9ACTN|nr:ABC transporter substrate-binding protein [Micromonospora gifhornensis]GIJ18665.1 branched-chain amino acid ABC transporter substrate-binding protein [Micromonospora gifhornensis]